MITISQRSATFAILFIGFLLPAVSSGEDRSYAPWREKSVQYGRIMSQVKWTPVADGMPKTRRTF